MSRIRSGRVKEALSLEEKKYERGGHPGNVASEEKESKGGNYISCRNKKNYSTVPHHHPLNKVNLITDKNLLPQEPCVPNA